MMPDKNEASDSTLNGSVDDVTSDAAGSAESVDATDSGPFATGEQAAQGQGGGGDPASDNDADMSDPVEPQDELGHLRAKLAEAEARATDNWDRLLRLQAEMENQRKRAQNDVTKARKFALEGIVGDLLPVKDSLEMGLAAAEAEDADPKAIVTGAELTLKMLAQVFEKNNIVEVNPVDEKFDPEFHQAMSMQEVEGKPSNTVASVMQKGYTLNDRLVRPALVMVAK